LRSLSVDGAYLDGELTGVRSDRTTSFALIQNVSDTAIGRLVFFLFDLLHLDGKDLMAAPLLERKERLQRILANNANARLEYSHVIAQGPAFRQHACSIKLEGVIRNPSMRPIDRAIGDYG
jgi:ATP-dependent DNA ligase